MVYVIYRLNPLKVQILLYSRYKFVDGRIIFYSEMDFIMSTKYTYSGSIYLYYRLNYKFVKWNENIYIYNPFYRFYINIIFNFSWV